MESMLDYQIDQMGNSEVGHMTIGSGRVLYQDLVKIHLAIKNDTLKDNVIVKNTIEKIKQYSSNWTC